MFVRQLYLQVCSIKVVHMYSPQQLHFTLNLCMFFHQRLPIRFDICLTTTPAVQTHIFYGISVIYLYTRN